MRLCVTDGGYLKASRIVLATGHSSRALFEELLAAGVTLTAKHFAMGFRIEHPQVTAAGAGLGLAIQIPTTCCAFDLLYISYQVCLLSVFRGLSMSCSTVLKAPQQSSEAKVNFTFILTSAAQQDLSPGTACEILQNLATPPGFSGCLLLWLQDPSLWRTTGWLPRSQR